MGEFRSAGLVAIMAALVVNLAGCDAGRAPAEVGTLSGSKLVRHHDARQVALGEQVFKQYCTACHGENAQGAFNWRQRDAEGLFPPPPLNGSGHAWHHPTAMLRDMIRNGSPPGKGRMPAWGDRLTEDEIAAVVEWFQSRWPDQVYAAWYDMQQRAQDK